MGLLGAYLRSLRDAGLVQRRSLKLEDNSTHALIDGVPFWWNGGISGFGWLKRTFARVEAGFNRSVLVELGRRLFSRADMHDVAARIKALGPSPAWRKAASRLGALNQKRVLAGVGSDLGVFCRRATNGFWELLRSRGQSVPDVPPELSPTRSPDVGAGRNRVTHPRERTVVIRPRPTTQPPGDYRGAAGRFVH